MWAPRWLKLTLFLAVMLSIGGAGGYVYSIFSDLPDISKLEGFTPIESSIVYSSDGRVLSEYYVERRTFIPYHKIPLKIRQAFIAIEDRRFYDHHGIDFFGILRALYRDIKAQGMVQGGSTITQQLAKIVFL